jgi:hypothetical protein
MGLLMRLRTNAAFLISLLSCAACSSETVAPPPKPPVGSLEGNKVPEAGADVVTAKERELPTLWARAVSSATAADAGAPFAGLVPLLDPDLAQFSFPGARPAHESAGIIAAHQDLFGAFDDRKMQLTRIWRTPSEQSFEWTLTGTHARDWKGVTATHKPVAFKGITLIWTKDDGSITDIHVYFDVTAVRAQLGAPVAKELAGLPVPAAPTGEPQMFEASQPTATETADVALARGALDAMENNNEAGYVGAFADDVQIETLERAQPGRGKDEAKSYYRAMHKAIGQLDTNVTGAWGVGQFAIVEYSVNGEQLGPIGWIPAQRDHVVRFEAVDVCEIQGGKIAHVWRYDNPGEIVTQ